MKSQVLVTGSAGFIGSHVVTKLLERGDSVVGIDNHNDYYDPQLKEDRLKQFINHNLYEHIKADVSSPSIVSTISKIKPNKIIHLAAQAGVRYSIENPYAYIDSNIYGFLNILEASKNVNLQHLVYASSSSVYGGNVKLPFSETDSVDHPVSLYATTKKANELMAHTYSHLFDIPSTGLRFFTVYGPWGRPDMALFLFARAMLLDEPIKVFNNGDMIRDFTYIDDIVDGVIKVLDKNPIRDNKYDMSLSDPSKSNAPFRIFNIGNSSPRKLMDYIDVLSSNLNTKPKIEFMPLQPGDVPSTHADTNLLNRWVGFESSTSIEEGIKNFCSWYKDYYKL